MQRHSSSCGVVKCERESGGKKIAAKNTGIRNPYLTWAFSEIIIKAQQDERRAKFSQRRNSKYGRGRAKSIIAHRFAVATYALSENSKTLVERFESVRKKLRVRSVLARFSIRSFLNATR